MLEFQKLHLHIEYILLNNIIHMNDTQAKAFMESMIEIQNDMALNKPKDAQQAAKMGHNIIDGYNSVMQDFNQEEFEKLRSQTSFGDAFHKLINQCGVRPSEFLANLENLIFTMAETEPFERNGITFDPKEYAKNYKRLKAQFLEYEKLDQELI